MKKKPNTDNDNNGQSPEPELNLKAETKSILIEKILADYQLAPEDIAHCVELYYDAQRLRIIHANKQRTEGKSPLKDWFFLWLTMGEKVVYSKLKYWVEHCDNPECIWAYNQVGVGPVIASGLASMIDVNRLGRISALWLIAGQAPGKDRKVKGQKLTYNPRLKVLMFKLGECFVKVSGNEKAYYGKVYKQFKQIEIDKNESGKYAEAAAKELASKKFRDDTETKARLLEGKLSDGHLHSRAKRKTVKMFLSHYWLVARQKRGLPISRPYVHEHLGHDDIILPQVDVETAKRMMAELGPLNFG